MGATITSVLLLLRSLYYYLKRKRRGEFEFELLVMLFISKLWILIKRISQKQPIIHFWFSNTSLQEKFEDILILRFFLCKNCYLRHFDFKVYGQNFQFCIFSVSFFSKILSLKSFTVTEMPEDKILILRPSKHDSENNLHMIKTRFDITYVIKLCYRFHL